MKMTVRWAVPVLAAAALIAPATATAQPAGPAGRIRPPGAPGPAAVKVPAGFQPVSASFYSAASWVLSWAASAAGSASHARRGW
jgi:hypothetical protein